MFGCGGVELVVLLAPVAVLVGLYGVYQLGRKLGRAEGELAERRRRDTDEEKPTIVMRTPPR